LNVLYRDETQEDVRQAIDLMTARTGRNDVVLGGLCAGAYQAFHTARVDERVRGLVLLDLLRWDPDAPVRRATGFWARRKSSLERLRANLPGRLRARSVLAQGLLEITARGTEVLLVSCREGGGLAGVETALAGHRRALESSGRFRLSAVDDTDHIFSPLWAQAWLADTLRRFLQDVSIG
jgi:hypothetical protein